MATQTKYPQSYRAWGMGQFTNPTNAYADDGSYASALTAFPVGNGFYNFGFDIPEDATINSVVIDAGVYSNPGAAAIYNWKMAATKGDTVRGTVSTHQSPTSEQNISNNDTGTWTAAELNSNASSGLNALVFVESLYSNVATYYLDYVRVTVDYTESGGGSSVSVGTTETGFLALPAVNEFGRAVFGSVGELGFSNFGVSAAEAAGLDLAAAEASAAALTPR